MALEKFIPEIWAKQFDKELERQLVFYENCNHKYEGMARQPGDTVKILGLGMPTLTSYSDGKLHAVPTPEEITDLSQTMPIRQIEEFAFYVDDLEKRQAEGGSGLLGEYMSQVKYAVSNKQDSFIAGLVADPAVVQAYNTAPTVVAGTAGSGEANILDAIDNAMLLLLENDVTRTTEITLTAPPAFVQMLKRAYVQLDTDNSEMMRNGRVGKYGGVIIKESNNVYKTGTAGSKVSHIQLKTNNAIAFVKPYLHLESYRPQGYFQDAVKGYSLYDGKVVRPKEIIDLNVKLGD
jgi:hypothetical protein